MKAVLRWGMGFAVVAALATAPAALHAQQADPPPAEESPSVGPRELENFTINGTVTTPAEPRQQAPASAPSPARPGPSTVQPGPATSRPAAPAGAAPALASPSRSATPPQTRVPSGDLLSGPDSSPSATAPAPGFADSTTAPALPEATPASDPGGFSPWPWLLAALALAGGAMFLWWRKQQSEPSYAGGPVHDPVPAPATRAPDRPLARAAAPAPVAPPAAPIPDPLPAPGVVSTRLRPWIDLGFEPSRCSVEDDKVTIDFEVEMVNSGNAPARGVLVEARMINASNQQDSEIGQFFANPVGEGERIDMIAPLKSVRLKSRIVTERRYVQEYDVGGRKVFVPLLAFNVLYGWSRGEGQTSLSYLIGRDTKGDKMAPFRLDVGPRLFRSLGKTPLPIAVRH